MGGLVQLATPCRIAHNAGAPARLVTEARVQHKAVKLMTKRRPKKVWHLAGHLHGRAECSGACKTHCSLTEFHIRHASERGMARCVADTAAVPPRHRRRVSRAHHLASWPGAPDLLLVF